MAKTANSIDKITMEHVRRAFSRVNRREFVPPEYRDQAGVNAPIAIGCGQTTSQPALIAWMIELLELSAGDRVLEVGTGSGYQTAILAELGSVEVYSLEIIPELAKLAAARLMRLGYLSVHLKQGDGHEGWPEHAPYDGILVSAACPTVPVPLAEQLVEAGRLVIPLGGPMASQYLWRFVKSQGELDGEALSPVAFVPLTGKGWTASCRH